VLADLGHLERGMGVAEVADEQLDQPEQLLLLGGRQLA
jgi:hypothetical protein